jgi:hypothetical protein
MSERYNLSVLLCKRHGVYAVALDDTKYGLSIRLTPQKCCGSWDVIAVWEFSSDRLQEIAGIIADQVE